MDGLQLLMPGLHKAAMSAEDLMVVENVQRAPDYKLPAAFKHTVILTACMADLPAQEKMSKNMHWGNALTCAHCTLNGQYARGAMRFLGYLTPVPYREHSNSALISDVSNNSIEVTSSLLCHLVEDGHACTDTLPEVNN